MGIKTNRKIIQITSINQIKDHKNQMMENEKSSNEYSIHLNFNLVKTSLSDCNEMVKILNEIGVSHRIVKIYLRKS